MQVPQEPSKLIHKGSSDVWPSLDYVTVDPMKLSSIPCMGCRTVVWDGWSWDKTVADFVCYLACSCNTLLHGSGEDRVTFSLLLLSLCLVQRGEPKEDYL